MSYMASLGRQGTLHHEMAETITEHHIPSLVASPSIDITHGSAGDYGLDIFDDSEFPYARGVINGIKCCSKCGATKTPQWREGPFGPKTLCNACGVKRTRKLRAEQDGTKRRKLTASPAGKSYAKAKPVYSQDVHESYDYDDGYPEAAYYHPSPQSVIPAGLRRPTRRAAEEAAVKTARYARTGEWAGMNNHHHHHHSEAPDHPFNYAAHYPVPAVEAATSSDISLPSSDCPEEVSWTPLAAEAAARNGLPGMPLDCYAAVNLMTMSVRSAENGSDGSPSVAPLLATPATAAVAPVAAGGSQPPLSRSELEATLAKMDSSSGGKLTAGDLSELYKSVPPAKVAELVRLNQDLDSALNETQAANAAVAAVAAVLAAKQAAALRSRELAISATKRLRRFMMELDTQFGVCHKTLPRIRTSPKKSTSL